MLDGSQSLRRGVVSSAWNGERARASVLASRRAYGEALCLRLRDARIAARIVVAEPTERRCVFG